MTLSLLLLTCLLHIAPFWYATAAPSQQPNQSTHTPFFSHCQLLKIKLLFLLFCCTRSLLLLNLIFYPPPPPNFCCASLFFFSLLFLSYTHFSFTYSQTRRTRNEMMQLPVSSTTTRTTSNNQPPCCCCCCCEPLTPLCTHKGNTRFRVIGFYVIYEMTPLSSAKSHLCNSLSLSLSTHQNTYTHTHPHLLHDALVTPTFFQVLQLPISSSSSLDLSVPMGVCVSV